MKFEITPSLFIMQKLSHSYVPDEKLCPIILPAELKSKPLSARERGF